MDMQELVQRDWDFEELEKLERKYMINFNWGENNSNNSTN